MDDTQGPTPFVETPTEYESSELGCDHPVNIYIGNTNNQTVTYICQQLSLFIETHDDEALFRVLETLSPALHVSSEYAISIGTPDNPPSDAWWPIELEIENNDRGSTVEIIEALQALAADDFNGPKQANRFRDALIEATTDQPRSIVRLVENGGDSRSDLEWHTDTEAELESN
jgi:hypothetical protein